MRKAIVGASVAALLATVAMLPAAAQVSAADPAENVTSTSEIISTGTTQQFIVRVRNEEVALVSEPLRVGANILMPLRESLEALGATDIRYVPATRQVTFQYQGRQGMVNLTTNQARLGDTPIAMAGPLRLINGTYYVRSEFLASLDPTFQVTRVQVAGFRGGEGFPEAANVTNFQFGGDTFTWDSPTYYSGGVLMVPLAETLNRLGIEADPFQPGDLQVVFQYGGQNVLVNVSSGYAYVGDQAWVLDRPVVTRRDMVYVPASFIARLVPGFAVEGDIRL